MEDLKAENLRLSVKGDRMKKQILDLQVVNRKMMEDATKQQAELARISQEMGKQRVKHEFETKTLQKELKFAKVDKAMFQLKVQELEKAN